MRVADASAREGLNLVFFGLSLTSSWGNGHAGTYRGLLRALHARGHRLWFFERDTEWYAGNRDLPRPPFADTVIYDDWADTRPLALRRAADADAVVIGSYFADAIPLLDDLLAKQGPPVLFYDIDTPVTLETLRQRRCQYLRADHIPALDAYLSFTGGPVLRELTGLWRARQAWPLYCACEESHYRPAAARPRQFALSYLGTYAPDRHGKFGRLVLETARRLPRTAIVVGGSMYPQVQSWPANVTYRGHLSPAEHPAFYRSARITLNLTRQAMVEAGYSPSVRLFEAACCGVPVVSDPWPGIEEFFLPGAEILLADDTAAMLDLLTSTSDAQLVAIAAAARARVLAENTSAHRARQLLGYIDNCRRNRPREANHRMAQRNLPVSPRIPV